MFFFWKGCFFLQVLRNFLSFWNCTHWNIQSCTCNNLWKIVFSACLFKKPISKVWRILNILICWFCRFGSSQKGAESHDLVSNLKIELERCLLSNKEKRIQVNKLQEELRTCKKDLEEFRMRCERAEKSETDLKVNWRVINNSEHHFHWFGKICSFEYTFIYVLQIKIYVNFDKYFILLPS